MLHYALNASGVTLTPDLEKQFAQNQPISRQLEAKDFLLRPRLKGMSFVTLLVAQRVVDEAVALPHSKQSLHLQARFLGKLDEIKNSCRLLLQSDPTAVQVCVSL